MRRAPHRVALALVGCAAASGCVIDDEAPETDETGRSTASTASTGDMPALLDDGASSGETGDGSGHAPSRDADDAAPLVPDEYVAVDFEGPDGDPWPSPWVEIGGVVDHRIDDGRGLLRGPAQTVARMGIAGVDALDFDAEVTVEFSDTARQDFGLWVRHNGGRLGLTDPPGQGYGILLEGGVEPHIGIWRERAGVEDLVGSVPVQQPLESLVPYRIRLQCIQLENATLLRTRIWRIEATEPDAWAVELIDVTPELQFTTGDIALDVYDDRDALSVLVDDFVVRPPA